MDTPKTKEEIVEYVRTQFRQAIDQFIGRPINPITLDSVRESVERAVRRVMPEVGEIRVTPHPDDPTAVEVTIYSPPVIIISFNVGTHKRPFLP